MSSVQPVFYKNVVPLNKEQHKELFLEPQDGFEFAGQANSLYVAAVEFPQASMEYPIVFARDNDEQLFPVALLGLKQGQNLYIDKSGKWDASYIPAYARRYPFILARGNAEDAQYAVCIDEGYTGFNTAKEGQPLFDKEGKETELLSQAVNFLQDYQKHVELTTQFCGSLSDLDLLEPMTANIQMKSGEKMSIGGFFCVSREKLKALKPGKMADLVKTDQMELIYLHLQSLRNVNSLLSKFA